MNTLRAFATISLSGLLTGCATFSPDFLSWNHTSSNADAYNFWVAQGDASNGYREEMRSVPSLVAQSAAPQAAPRPQMPLRTDVVAQRPSNGNDERGNIRPVSASVATPNTCEQQRAAFGGAEERRIAFLIQLDIEQARAVAESPSIDAATKAQLLTELSREVKALSRKSQGIELFRDGVYALCQAHANGAITPAAYSDRFDELIRTANESIQLESANFQFTIEGDSIQPASMKRR